MAKTAIVGEKVGMTQMWVDDQIVPVTVLKVDPARVVQVKTAERDGYTALQVTYGHSDAKKLDQARAGHFAKARRPGPAPRRAAPRLGRRLRGRPGDHGRRPRRRRARSTSRPSAGARASPAS